MKTAFRCGVTVAAAALSTIAIHGEAQSFGQSDIADIYSRDDLSIQQPAREKFSGYLSLFHEGNAHPGRGVETQRS